jgi:hypothetical protein
MPISLKRHPQSSSDLVSIWMINYTLDEFRRLLNLNFSSHFLSYFCYNILLIQFAAFFLHNMVIAFSRYYESNNNFKKFVKLIFILFKHYYLLFVLYITILK